ncbi:BRCA1-A complex subunit Abraxas 1 [Astyanax mexicanus]|uniref:BRCA1-A complex subunit Abraxas 1 n=2 Tax=Astyanax mexicanus TaxID=7994 RepID=A0A8T2L0S8_ASTMX|nr:BRCA1-A complex subunit Abraxas 1 [Astyanax mexicanus]
MEEYSTTVRLSGFVLGSLMFQHLNTDSDVEGLLVGESVREEKSKITDSQTDHIQFLHTINIQKHITCRRIHSFYNNACEIDEEKIREITSNFNEENVIGWYRQRRNTTQQMTLKEQLVHQNLRRLLPHQEFIFILLTPSDTTSSGSTHRLEYTAFIWNGSQYSSVLISLGNLGMLDQQDYWRFSTTCPSLSRCQAVKKHKTKFFSTEDDLREVEKVSNMNDALLDEMKTACEKVEKSERLVEKLQADITELKEAISKQKKKQQQCNTTETSTPNEPKENVLLCAALKALFPNSPSLRTQTLTVQGFPVLEVCCSSEHGIDIPSRLPLVLEYEQGLRKRKTSRDCRSQEKSQVAGTSLRRKRKRNTTDTQDPVEEEEVDNLQDSNSPVF